MDCDFFYYYNDGIAESTYFGLEWFSTPLIFTTMELLSLPFADSVVCKYFNYNNNGIVEFTFCGLGWFATTVRLDFLRGRAVYHIV